MWFGVNIGKEVSKVVTRKELGGMKGVFYSRQFDRSDRFCFSKMY